MASIDLCIPVEMAPPGFTTTIKWYRDNVQIAGAAAATYTATIAGYYKYSISNNCATSYLTALNLFHLQACHNSPQSAVSPVCNGNTINFTATNPIPEQPIPGKPAISQAVDLLVQDQELTFHT